MAYGCQSSLEHANAKLERVGVHLEQLRKTDDERGETTTERQLLVELTIVVGYLFDAMRYLKDGVP